MLLEKKAFFWASNEQLMAGGRNKVIKSKFYVPILVLACLSISLLVIVAKAFWVIIQVNVYNEYHDSSPLAHINAIGVLSAVFLTFSLPRLMARVKPRYLLAFSLFLSALMVMSFPFISVSFWGYIITIGVLITSTVAQVIGLTIINETLADAYRTTFQGIYNTLYYLSVAVGPMLVATYGAQYHYALYIYLAIALAVTGAALFLTHSNLIFTEPPGHHHPSRLHRWFEGWHTLNRAPVLFMMSVMTCLNIGVSSNLLVFWGESYHMNVEAAKELPAIFSLGAALLTIPLSYIADRLGVMRTFYGISFVLSICYIVLSLDCAFEMFDYVALFLLGGCISTMTAITLSHVGHFFTNINLAKATAGFSLLRLMGNILGMYMAGEVIDEIKAYGLNLVMGILNLVFIFVLLLIWRKTTTHKDMHSHTH